MGSLALVKQLVKEKENSKLSYTLLNKLTLCHILLVAEELGKYLYSIY